MAEIPVEKKSGVPGWLWPLLALLAAALILWLLLRDDDDAEVVEQPVVAEDTTTGAVATPLAAGAAAGAATAYTIGQTVDLDNARVTSLAGDMAFNVEANGQPMLVVFDETATPQNAAREGQIDVNPGTIVNLEGTVRSGSEQPPAGFNATIPAGTQQYLQASRIEVLR